MQNSLNVEKTPAHAIRGTIMFLERPRPHFLPSSTPPSINLAKKDNTTTVYICMYVYICMVNYFCPQEVRQFILVYDMGKKIYYIFGLCLQY